MSDSGLAALIAKFQSSSWIWTPSNPPNINSPPGDVAFRKTYTSSSGKTAANASILATVDNQFSLYVNGNLVGSSPNVTDSWFNALAFSSLLEGNSNLFAFRATNLAAPVYGTQTPAGLIAAILITYTDGSSDMSVTDTTWKASSGFPSNFASPSVSDSSWSDAAVKATYGQGPWASLVTFPQTIPPPATLNPTSTSTSATAPSTSSGYTLNPSTGSPTSITSTTSTLPPQTSSKSVPIGAIIGAVLGGLGLFLIAALVGLWIIRRQKPAASSGSSTSYLQVPPSDILPSHATNSTGRASTSTIIPFTLTEPYPYDRPPPAWDAEYHIPPRPQPTRHSYS